jgi:type VI secretion system protein ImpF
MPRTDRRERLQPSLLDRLADEVQGIEREMKRVRLTLLPQLDEARKETLASLVDPERPNAPRESELACFAELGSDVAELVHQLVSLEHRRQRELKTRVVVSPERLQACVLRDLTWLLNTHQLSWHSDGASDPTSSRAAFDIEAYPHTAASVVNFGIPALAGRTPIDPEVVARDLEQAIRRFEPRLRAGTVRVSPVAEAQIGHLIAFDIEAVLWSEPVPLRLLMRTLIDLENGAASLRPAGAG